MTTAAALHRTLKNAGLVRSTKTGTARTHDGRPVQSVSGGRTSGYDLTIYHLTRENVASIRFYGYGDRCVTGAAKIREALDAAGIAWTPGILSTTTDVTL
jgi:hypothetical protein